MMPAATGAEPVMNDFSGDGVPTYDYQCRSCGRITEVIHSMLEDGPRTCDACGGELRRVLYPTGIIFKGSGFYRTDSRKDAPAPTPSGDGAGAAASGADASKAAPGKAPASEKASDAATKPSEPASSS
jgi:putative FmdB family regulatory protein